MLSLDYIAGLIDADGSISISISKNRYKSKNGVPSPQFTFTVNLRQVSQYKHILEEVKESLNMGKLYDHAGTNSSPMCSWQTTKIQDTLEISKLLEPHLHIKRKEAALMIEALELWINNTGDRQGAGYSRPDWVKQAVMEIANKMNPSQQKETSRRNKALRESLNSTLTAEVTV